ncbi:MAG: apolipoprotein N-acyltransferase [Pseudomonadota bacterium]
MNGAARFASMGRWRRGGLAALSGAAMALGHAPVDLPWVLFLTVPLIVVLVAQVPTARAAAWVGWFAGFGYFAVSMHWIGYAFLVDAERFAWLLPIGTFALPAGLAFFWALAFGVARRFWPGTIAGLPWLVAIWSLAEFARGNILTGLPWALPGYVWVETPVMQTAAWVGPYAMTLITLVLTGLPALAIVLTRRARVVALVLPIATVAGLWLAGTARIPDTVAYAPDAPVVRVIQPNAPQELKWQREHAWRFYQRALQLTAAPPVSAHGAPDIIVWPEATLALVLEQNGEELRNIAAAAGGAHVLAGTLYGETRGADVDWSNAVLTLSPDGEILHTYRKHHLVPFGEYLPLKPLFDALGLSQFAVIGGMQRGEGPETVSLPGLPAFSPLICYEAIFPNALMGDTRPDWLVQPTNDAWFGPFAGPQQHLAQARIRAIEQGLPLVRAANTGISAIIDPHGRIMTSLPLDMHGATDGRLPAPLAPTLYARTGDWPWWIATAFILLLAQARRRTGS